MRCVSDAIAILTADDLDNMKLFRTDAVRAAIRSMKQKNTGSDKLEGEKLEALLVRLFHDRLHSVTGARGCYAA